MDFKKYSNKIFSFGGHIQISKYDLNQSFQENAIEINPKFIASCRSDSGIKSVSIYSNKAGLIKANEEVHGVVLKGINKDYPASYFSTNIKSGRFLTFDDTSITNQILISQKNSPKFKT